MSPYFNVDWPPTCCRTEPGGGSKPLATYLRTGGTQPGPQAASRIGGEGDPHPHPAHRPQTPHLYIYVCASGTWGPRVSATPPLCGG